MIEPLEEEKDTPKETINWNNDIVRANSPLGYRTETANLMELAKISNDINRKMYPEDYEEKNKRVSVMVDIEQIQDRDDPFGLIS